MGIKVTGVNKLKKLQKSLKELEKTQQIPLPSLLNDSFLNSRTNFSSFDEFESASIFQSYSSIEEIPDDEMDTFISQNSSFSSWEELLTAATEEYLAKKLRF